MNKQTFSEFFNSLNEMAGLVVYSHNGKNVVDTKHSMDRRDERSILTDDQFDLLFKRMIEKFEQIGDDKLNSEEYLVYSTSLKQGVIVAYREDRFNNDGKKNFYIITILPTNNQFAKKGTRKIVVEGYAKRYSDELIDFLSSYINEDELNESVSYDTVSITEDVNIIMNGKNIYDMSCDVIEIE